jgi:transposase
MNMAYNPKGVMDIHEIIRRWRAGNQISAISRAMGIDRKTVRSYIRSAEQAGIERESVVAPPDQLLSLLSGLTPCAERQKPACAQLEPYRDEILALISQKTDPVKPKTAYEIMLVRHPEIQASYSSFKRLMRQWQVSSTPRSTCRFESDPGQEIQIDYAKVGLLFDQLTGRNRIVYAFIATLSFSRFKFIEFVFTQEQRSFAGSHIRMFLFFGGVAASLLIDT